MVKEFLDISMKFFRKEDGLTEIKTFLDPVQPNDQLLFAACGVLLEIVARSRGCSMGQVFGDLVRSEGFRGLTREGDEVED